MVFYGNAGTKEDEGKIAWDLRRIHAEKIVGETLMQIAHARKTDNYPMWFKLLKRDLSTEVYKNLDDEQNESIKTKIKEVITIINRNKNVYINKEGKPEQFEAVENALIELEQLITVYMKKNDMFGSKDVEDDGL